MTNKTAIFPEVLFTGNDFLTGMAVIIVNDRITDVLPAAQLPEQEDCLRLAAPGHTLLPGLIDAHVHLTMCGCCSPRQHMMKDSDELLLLRAARNAQQLIGWGITTVRDCGDRNGVTFHLREAIKAGVAIGPDLLLTGPPLTSARGHCYFMLGEVVDEEHMQARIKTAARREADFIKVMLTGGGLTPGTDSLNLQFSKEELSFLVTCASEHGMYVAAHAHSPQSIALAASCGVRTIEHASFVDRQHGVFADPSILQQLADSGSIVVPTNVPAVNAVRMGRQLGLAKELGISSAEFLDNRRIVTRQMREAGITLLSGSDAGATHVSFNDIKGEIRLMFEAGMSTVNALATATSLAAEQLHLEKTGRVEPGFMADLLLVKGDCRNDLQALEQTEGVWKKGKRLN